MAVSTGRVRIIFEGDESDLERAVRSSQAAIGRLDQTTKRVTTSTATATSETSRFAKATSGLGNALKTAGITAGSAVLAYLSISQATSAITTTEDLAKATKSLHENLGLSIRSASAFAAVLRARGVDSTKAGMAFKTLATQVTAARDGSDSAVEQFRKLGFSQEEIQRGAKDTQFLIGAVADGLNNLSAGSDKAAISGRLFGRGWQTVQPVLRDGSAAMQEQLDLANKYGAAFGGKTLKSVSDLIAAQRELKLAQLGLQVQFTKHIAPALIDAGLALAQFINEMRRGRGVGGTVADVFRRIGSVLSDLGTFAKDFFETFRHAFVAAGGVLEGFGHLIKITANLLTFRFGDAWDEVKEFFRDGARAIGRIFEALPDPIKDAARAIGRIFGGLGRGIHSVAKGIVNVVRHVGGVVKDVVGFIVNAVNKAVGALGDLKDAVPNVDLGHIPGTPIPTNPITALKDFAGLFARGGTIPGQGDGDTVPILAEPGEFFVNKRATQMYRPLLEAINSGTPRFGTKAPEPSAYVLPVAVGRQGGGLARLRRTERRLVRQVHRQEGAAQRHTEARLESLRIVIEMLTAELREQNRQHKETKRVLRAQRGVLEERIAALASSFIGSQVGLAGQAAGVPGSVARL